MRMGCRSLFRAHARTTVPHNYIIGCRSTKANCNMSCMQLVLLSLFLVALLPLARSQGQCLPRVVLSTFVRATVVGPGNGVPPPVCSPSFDVFRGELGKVAARNIELSEGCILLSVGGGACRESGQLVICCMHATCMCLY